MYTAKQKHDLYENKLIKPYYLSHWNQPHRPSAERDARLGQLVAPLQINTSRINFNSIWTTCGAASRCASPRSHRSELWAFLFFSPTNRETPHCAANQSSPHLQPHEGAAVSWRLELGQHVALYANGTRWRLSVVKLQHCNAFSRGDSARQEKIQMLPMFRSIATRVWTLQVPSDVGLRWREGQAMKKIQFDMNLYSSINLFNSCTPKWDCMFVSEEAFLCVCQRCFYVQCPCMSPGPSPHPSLSL